MTKRNASGVPVPPRLLEANAAADAAAAAAEGGGAGGAGCGAGCGAGVAAQTGGRAIDRTEADTWARRPGGALPVAVARRDVGSSREEEEEVRKVYSQRDGGDNQPPSATGVGGVWGDGRHMLEGMAGAI